MPGRLAAYFMSRHFCRLTPDPKLGVGTPMQIRLATPADLASLVIVDPIARVEALRRTFHEAAVRAAGAP